MSTIITFTTDFGTADGYVAAMKGVVLGINPEATLVDISHSIAPQNISQAAFVLDTMFEYFPSGTVHLTIIDPGVGTERKAIVLRTPVADFVAPDNGVLTYIVRRYADVLAGAVQYTPTPGDGLEVIVITNAEFWRSPVSATFHGRDIFAPVAAHLSLGTPLSAFGEPPDSLNILPLNTPECLIDGTLVGYVIHIDHFGNLITNIRSEVLPKDTKLSIEIENRVIAGLSHTYDTSTDPVALIGSSGLLEIALPGASAADSFKATIGTEVRIKAAIA